MPDFKLANQQKTVWGLCDALIAVDQALEVIGYPVDEKQLVRLGENALFALPRHDLLLRFGWVGHHAISGRWPEQ